MSVILKDVLKNKKLLVFDFDGVIVNSEIYHYFSHKATLDSYGIGSIFNLDIYKKYHIGNKTSTIMKNEVLRAYSLEYIDVELFNYLISDNNILSMSNLKENFFLQFVKNGDIPLNEFIVDFIISLNKDIDCIILSASDKNTIESILEKVDYTDVFIDIISTSDNNSNKDIELRGLLSRYNVNSNEVAFFEDNECNLKIGKKLGIYSIGVEHDVNIDKLSSYDILIKEGVIYEK